MKNKLAPYFRRNTLGFKIVFLTIIYLFLLIAALSPFIFIKESSKTLAIILFVAISLIYFVILLLFNWDWFKNKYDSNDK